VSTIISAQSLRGLHPEIEALLESVGIPPTARAEEIDLERFCALARALVKAECKAG
jgi:16S rRNA (adenine1518-N6/adenine1519-N6)-dimethyltransferase